MKKDHLPEYRIPVHNRSVHALLYKLKVDYKAGTLLISATLYASILLLFGDFLKISSNYFVVLPLLAFSFIFGLPGGLVSGVLALPTNLIIFKFLGHLEYAPDNLLIAESTGILMGTFLGVLSQYFMGMLREIDQRVQTEARLRAILQEKKTLLSEVNHRVRNNLNIITSLIQLHSNKVDDPAFREECDHLRNRVYTISLVHEQLFLENQPLFLDLSSYIDSLLDNMLVSMNCRDLVLKKHWPEQNISLSSDRVISLGLIVHEVVMNSIKYGVLPGRDFILSISMDRQEDESFLLRIDDNGPGFDPEEAEKGLGLKLIESLSGHLGGTSRWEKGDGSSFLLSFRDENPVPEDSENEISR